MERVRIGLIGCGSMGQAAHLRYYSRNAACEVAAVAELRPELAKAVAAKYSIPRWYPEANDLLEAEQLDGVVLIQPFTTHRRIVPEVLSAGVPTIIEKPLARSAEHGEVVLAAVASSGTRLFVAYHKRSDPAIVEALRRISSWRCSGVFGRMKYVRITMPPGDWVEQGFADMVQSGEPYPELPRDRNPGDLNCEEIERNDAFVNYYIHQVNLMRHLLGEDYRFTYWDPGDVLLAGRSSSGVSCALEMAPYETGIDWQESALVCFERAWLRVDLPAPLASDRPGRLTIYEDAKGGSPSEFIPTLPWHSAMMNQADSFIRAIRGEKTQLCEAAEALDDLRLARSVIDLQRASV